MRTKQTRDTKGRFLPIHGKKSPKLKTSRKTKGRKTYVITSVQNNTDISDDLLLNLLAYCETNQAELMVIPMYTKPKGKLMTWFSRKIRDFLVQDNVYLTDKLLVCGGLERSPNLIQPFSGVVTYSNSDCLILPSTKQNLQSVPTQKQYRSKLMYGTGSLSLVNYTTKNAPILEEMHKYGALVVEVQGNRFWCRHLEYDGTGFCDLDKYYKNGREFDQPAVSAIVHGDLHFGRMDEKIFDVMFKMENSVQKVLNPNAQVFHDTIDFYSASHHTKKDHIARSVLRYKGDDDIDKEYTMFARAYDKYMRKQGTKDIFVTGNHDEHVDQFLDDPDGFKDPTNMQFWLNWNYKKHVLSIAKGTKQPVGQIILDKYIRDHASEPNPPAPMQRVMNSKDNSVQIHGFELGMHGDLGANGARGSLVALKSLKKAVIGHSHSTHKINNMVQVGTYSTMEMGYNRGLSSWNHSFCILHMNGTAQIVVFDKALPWRDF